MRKALVGLCGLLAAFCADAAEPKRPMALVVMWDGARADALVNAELVNLRKLAFGEWQPGYNGAWSFCGKPIEDARPYSFANHASIMNGVTCRKHGVTFNHTAHLCRTDKWPCWLTRLLDAKPEKKAAYVYACDHYDWDLCRDERVAHKNYGLDDAGKADHLVRLYSSPDETPDAAVLFVDEPDTAGHTGSFYPLHPKYRAALEENDRQLGKVLDAIAARPTFKDEDWLVLMTSDHGGYRVMHGWEDAHSRTTPVVLAGRHVVNGQMAGFPRGQDVAATMLAHFGVPTAGMDLDSVEIGKSAATWGPAKRLDEALTWYYPILAKGRYLDNAVKDGPGATLFGDEEYFNPNRSGGPFKTPCLWIGGYEDVPCGAALSDSTELFLAPHPAFTISFWAKIGKREGVPVVLGNKDFSRVGGPGFVLTTGRHTERTENGLCLVFGTDGGRDTLVGTLDVEYDRWGFYALVFTGEGQVWLYQGRQDGAFHWISARAEDARLGSGLPLVLGNDGTMTYKWNFRDFLDDIAVWKRPLAMGELRKIFQAGREGRQLKDVADLAVADPTSADFIDTTGKAAVAP